MSLLDITQRVVALKAGIGTFYPVFGSHYNLVLDRHVWICARFTQHEAVMDLWRADMDAGFDFEVSVHHMQFPFLGLILKYWYIICNFQSWKTRKIIHDTCL